MEGPANTPVTPFKHAEDFDLVRRALLGEDEAVRHFESEYRPTLCRVLMARGVDRGQADDLVADVIAECFGAGKKGETKPLLTKFEGRSSLSTWLIRTTWNRWLDLKRRDKFRGDLPEFEGDEGGRNGDKFDRLAGDDLGEDVLEEDLSSLMSGAIKKAFGSLEPDALLMLKLSYLHGLSQTAISKMWQCDQTRVSRTLTAARQQIASETMKALQEADSDLEIEWEDFKRLCAVGIEI